MMVYKETLCQPSRYIPSPGASGPGSYSLKSVLLVLVPEMTYDGMEISDGEMASQAYFTMGEISDPVELAKLRKALLDYCRQDTPWASSGCWRRCGRSNRPVQNH